jgi:hypothetical protein
MTKIQTYTLLPILAFSLMLNSCIHCIDGNGTLATEDRTNDVKTFTQIELCGSFDVEIIQDSVQRLTIEGDQNILPYIRTKVSGKRLIIDTETNHCINTEHSIKLTIASANIETIILDGSGSIVCDSLSTTELSLKIYGSGDAIFNKLTSVTTNVEIDGSGDVNISGTSSVTSLKIEGSGDIKASGLIQKKCNTVINGSGEIHTQFTESLTGVINGSGDIYFIGSKDNVDITINGSGSVINNN